MDKDTNTDININIDTNTNTNTVNVCAEPHNVGHSTAKSTLSRYPSNYLYLSV